MRQSRSASTVAITTQIPPPTQTALSGMPLGLPWKRCTVAVSIADDEGPRDLRLCTDAIPTSRGYLVRPEDFETAVRHSTAALSDAAPMSDNVVIEAMRDAGLRPFASEDRQLLGAATWPDPKPFDDLFDVQLWTVHDGQRALVLPLADATKLVPVARNAEELVDLLLHLSATCPTIQKVNCVAWLPGDLPAIAEQARLAGLQIGRLHRRMGVPVSAPRAGLENDAIGHRRGVFDLATMRWVTPPFQATSHSSDQ